MRFILKCLGFYFFLHSNLKLHNIESYRLQTSDVPTKAFVPTSFSFLKTFEIDLKSQV